MGWRFRKTFGRGPFRWTLSKKGVGWSWGIPGLRYGVSPSGQKYVSAGIPGTGFYYIKYFPTKTQPPQSLPTQSQPALPSPTKTPPTQQPTPPNQQPWWKQKGL